nr:phospholipase-like protein [Tanacetum cinerariifolium]
MWYAPRSPPVSIGGLYDEYLIKRSTARAAKQKDSGEFHPDLRGRQKGREAALIDRVRNLEGLCESLLTLPKEVKHLRGHIFKLESIIQHHKRTYSSKQDDQIIRLADQRQHDDILKMAEEAEQKIESEIQRLYDHREARLNKIAEEEKQRKFIWHMNSSAHMKLAIDRCVPKKRKYVDDLKRPFNKIDRIFLSHDLEEWLSRSVMVRCKFPWCNDIYVDRSFWNGLCILDDNCKGWLVDEKNIDPAKYKISFRHVDHVPKQGEVFGDCGVFLCMFLYSLAYGVPFPGDDPVHAALAYREKNDSLLFLAQDGLSLNDVCLSFGTLSRI